MSKSAPLCASVSNFSTNPVNYTSYYYDKGSANNDQTNAIWIIASALPVTLGTIGNAFYCAILSKTRLHTATFAYLRILAIFHIVYCAVILPLWLTCHLLPVSFITLFIKLKILPSLIQATHFLLLCIAVCLPSRLIKQLQYLTYLRPWHSHTFIAWRKLIWGIPICICLNLVLYFEQQIIPLCNSTHSTQVFSVNLTVFGRKEWFKLWFVRFMLIVFYWLLVIVTAYHILCFLRAFHTKTHSNREWLESITVIKHEHLLRNIQPMLISLVICYGIAFIPKTISLWTKLIQANSLAELILFAYAYTSSPFLTLFLSKAFRNEFRVQIVELFCNQQDLCIGQVYGRLSRQNSEYIDGKEIRSSIKGQRKQCASQNQNDRTTGLKNALKMDAKQRVRFVMHPTRDIPYGTNKDSNAEESAPNDLDIQPRKCLSNFDGQDPTNETTVTSCA